MPFRRSATRRAFSARRWAKKRRGLIRRYNRRKTLRKTRRTVKRDRVERTKVLASFKWNESRIMRHTGYAGYDRAVGPETSGYTMEQGLNAPLTMFDRSGLSVAAHGDQKVKFGADGTEDDDWDNNMSTLLGKNFLDLKYPYGRPMNDWTLRPNHCFLPDVHGTIGKTYWALHDGCDVAASEGVNAHRQVFLRPQPVVHRPHMIDRYAREYEKFCVLGVTFDVAVQALPYDTTTYGDPVLPKDEDLLEDIDSLKLFDLLKPLSSYNYSEMMKADVPALVNRIAPSGMRATGIKIDETFHQSWAYTGINRGTAQIMSIPGSNPPATQYYQFTGQVNMFPNISPGNGYLDIVLHGADYTMLTPGRVFAIPDPRVRSYSVGEGLSRNFYGFGTPVFFRIESLEQPAAASFPGVGIRVTHAYYKHGQLTKNISRKTSSTDPTLISAQYDFYKEFASAAMLKDSHAQYYAADVTVQPPPTAGYQSYVSIVTEEWKSYCELLINHDNIVPTLIRENFLRPTQHGLESAFTFFDFKFSAAVKGGTMPAQTDAYKGPGYFVARITNQKRLDDEKFQSSAWDVNRLLENRKRSCKVKYIRHDDKRVKKLRVSWTLQQQKKFRPKGFRKKVPRVADHHHDVSMNSMGKPSAAWNELAHSGSTQAMIDGAGPVGNTGPVSVNNQAAPPAPGATQTGYHLHSVATDGTTSGPHVDGPVDNRAPAEIISDDYSLRGSAGKPLTVTEQHFDFYNPAVGEIDLMMNRDFPKDEQPRLFMQYLRPHTDDPFDDHKGILQPPPVRVRVTARYRVAFFKTPPKKDYGNATGGENDFMDMDGATDPLIKQNPAPSFVFDPSTKSIKKSVIQTHAAAYPGDGFNADGSYADEDDITKLPRSMRDMLSMGSTRIYGSCKDGSHTLLTSDGVILNPNWCFGVADDIAEHALYHGMDEYTKASVDQLKVDAAAGDGVAYEAVQCLNALVGNRINRRLQGVDETNAPEACNLVPLQKALGTVLQKADELKKADVVANPQNITKPIGSIDLSDHINNLPKTDANPTFFTSSKYVTGALIIANMALFGARNGAGTALNVLGGYSRPSQHLVHPYGPKA